MSTSENPSLRVCEISKDFGKFRALDGINLTVEDGEFVCFLGPSGCGKTTLLRIIAGLEPQTSGTIEQNGVDVSSLPPAGRDFGIVFQSYALFPNLNVAKNVGYGLHATGASRAASKARVTELLDLVGLSEQEHKFPAALSGGQQQRVALARALATSPGLLLLDEPLSALDARVRTRLRREIKRLQRRLHVTTIMVTHDQEEALTMADRIVVMNQGVIEQVGTPSDVYGKPDSLFVADFIGSMNRLDCEAATATSVKVDHQTIQVEPHGLAPGTAAVAVVRPEDIVPSVVTDPVDAKNSHHNRIDVRVEEMEFLGSYWRCELNADALPTATLMADFSANAIRRLNVTVGATIRVELPTDRLRVFARD